MSIRVLYVAGEVAPFSKTTAASHLIRELPERLQETDDFEARIMMPRYGTVSERRNRLHEVIRLSGAEIPVGERVETLKVKVASIPGIRLQVYFMDNAHFFKRKGIYKERKSDKVFEDNAHRALYFSRAALNTAENLGWSPDIVHASGWISALLPVVLKTEYASHELFADAKAVFTPDDTDVDVRFSTEEIETVGLPSEAGDRELRELGSAYADLTVLTADAMPAEDAVLLPDDDAEAAELMAEQYRRLLGREVATA